MMTETWIYPRKWESPEMAEMKANIQHHFLIFNHSESLNSEEGVNKA